VSAQFDTPAPAPAPTTCPLCGNAVAADATRCGSCGYHLAGIGGRPSAFNRRALWWSAAALVVVYLVTLLIVALAR
jgi:predicted nucleic acid-binding Zn ribbon protein